MAFVALLVGGVLGVPAAHAQKVLPQVEIRRADGQLLQGDLLQIDDGVIELQIDGQQSVLALQNVEEIRFVNGNGSAGIGAGAEVAQPRAYCQLVDGSALKLRSMESTGNEIVVRTMGTVEMVLDKSSVRRVLFFDPNADGAMRQNWDAFLQTFDSPSDAIVANKNGNLRAIEGVVGDLTDQTLTFVMGQREAVVRLEKLTGILFYRAAREFAAMLALVELGDGSTLSVQQIIVDDGVVELVARSGNRIALKPSQIARIDFSVGRSVYLSDMIPTTNDWKPLIANRNVVDRLARLRLARFDESFGGRPLAIGSQVDLGEEFSFKTETFRKGIAMSGGGRLAYGLNGQFKRLTALVGFDPDTERLPGCVRLLVYADGQPRLEQVLENRLQRKPAVLDIDVAGVQRLVIRVDYEDGRTVGDRLHVVNAKLTR